MLGPPKEQLLCMVTQTFDGATSELPGANSKLSACLGYQIKYVDLKQPCVIYM